MRRWSRGAGSLGWSSTELQWKKAHLKKQGFEIATDREGYCHQQRNLHNKHKRGKAHSVDSAALYLHAGMHHYKG